jgi:hypothetical protein
LYDSSNIDPDNGVNFPDPDDVAAVEALGTSQSFSGDVFYVGDGGYGLIRGDKGYSVGEGVGVTALIYKMSVTGNGPTNALSNIEAGFYRIGPK